MPERIPFRRRGPVAVLTVAALASASALVGATPSFAATCATSQVDIVAHPDDDLLFQNPDILHAIGAGGCVTTAYVTAGDDGNPLTATADAPQVYWQQREAGVKAAYATMAGVADAWTPGSIVLAGQTVTTAVLTAKPTVTLVFLRLPDGGLGGAGYPSTGNTSLPKLDQGTIGALSAVDGSATYTKASLSQALLDLMTAFGATDVHTQDWGKVYGDDDHDDHIMVAHLTQTVSAQYPPQHTITRYVDYQNDNWPQNVLGDDLTAKIAAFNAYAQHDKNICWPVESTQCSSNYEIQWIKRQIFETLTVNPAPAPAPSTPAPAPSTPAPAPSTPAPPAPTTPTTPIPAPLPGEAGRPVASIKDTTLTSKQFLTSGVTATFTGLTAGKTYQASFAVGDSGAVVGKPVVANAKGVVTGTWKPSTKALPALGRTGSFQLVLSGVQTTAHVAKTFVVKYDSRLAWQSVKRTGGTVTLRITASHATAGKAVVWKGVTVTFQKRVGSTWRTVATDRTDSRGLAVKTVKAGTASWRAVLKSTSTVWGVTARTVKR
jgi:hypothetical protein